MKTLSCSRLQLLLLMMMTVMMTVVSQTSAEGGRRRSGLMRRPRPHPHSHRDSHSVGDDDDDDESLVNSFYDTEAVDNDLAQASAVSVLTDGDATVDDKPVDAMTVESLQPIRRHPPGSHQHHHQRRRHRLETQGTGQIRLYAVHHPVNGPRRRRRGWRRSGGIDNITMEDKVERVCRRLNVTEGVEAETVADDGESMVDDDMMAVPWRVARRVGRRHLSADVRQTILQLWIRRRRELTQCCAKIELRDRMACVKEAQMSRFKRVCNGEEPICPWSLLKSAHHQTPETTSAAMTEQPSLTTKCCSLEGDERLTCFQLGIAEYKKRWHHRKAAMTSESSEDESRNNGRRRGHGRRRRPHHRKH